MNNKILNGLIERDLHCVLNKYCSEVLDIKVKTIYHEQSTKNKGKSEWLHPDMVGFQLTTSNWDSNITNVCKDFSVSKALLYSFELKKSITVDTLREYYFQAVSNSSWANEGYLVAASIDEMDSDLISEIKRLVGAFGIGIIKLDILNPSNSSILFTARRKDVVDGETMNKLYSINPNYREYIQNVSNSLQINTMIQSGWDDNRDYDKINNKIKDKENLNNSVKCLNINTDKVINAKKDSVVESSMDNNVNKLCLSNKNVQLSYTEIIKCVIEGNTYNAKDWADLMFKVSVDLKNKDSYCFDRYKEVSRLYSEVEKKNYTYYHNELGLYVGSLSINSKYRELQKLLKTYNIDLDNCFIYYKDRVVKEKSVVFTETSVDLNFSKPIKCVLVDKEYIATTWKSLIYNILVDFNNINSNLFKEYAKNAAWCTETKRWKDSRYSEELGIYLGALGCSETYREIKKILNIYNIDLNKCVLYYEGK